MAAKGARSLLGSVFRSNLFEGKVAIVTGGGTGIGKAITQELSSLGCKVVIASRKYEVLCQSSEEINKTFPEKVHPIQCNIRKEAEVKQLMEKTVADFGKIDYLVNNGGGQFMSSFSDMNTKGWNAVVDTNLNGTYFCLREAYHAWMGKNGGNIVNIVVDNFNGMPLFSHTAAARAGIMNLTKSLALEWAPNNIRINSVAPGVVYSDTARANYAKAGLSDVFDLAKKQIPMKRVGTVEEVSSVVCFLLSPAASFISGDCVKVDGAQSLYAHSGFKAPDHENSTPYTWQSTLKSNL